MPNDLDRMFAALSADADAARLAPAATVRRRADRRLAMQSVAGVAAVAVLATGAITGTRFVLTARDGGTPNPPAQSAPAVVPPITEAPSNPPSDPPSTAPSSAESTPPANPSGAPARSIPRSVPDRAFLQPADWPGDLEGPTRQDTAESPEICGTSWGSDDRIGVRATASMLFRGENTPSDYVPDGTISHTVTVYRGDGAEQFLDELRKAVLDCAGHRSLGSVDAGDDSVLVRIAVPGYADDGSPVDGENVAYLGATRVGDSVAMVEVRGWESASSEQAESETFTRKAADRLEAWRDRP